jgi:hypothetical protein
MTSDPGARARDTLRCATPGKAGKDARLMPQCRCLGCLASDSVWDLFSLIFDFFLLEQIVCLNRPLLHYHRVSPQAQIINSLIL